MPERVSSFTNTMPMTQLLQHVIVKGFRALETITKAP